MRQEMHRSPAHRARQGSHPLSAVTFLGQSPRRASGPCQCAVVQLLPAPTPATHPPHTHGPRRRPPVARAGPSVRSTVGQCSLTLRTALQRGSVPRMAVGREGRGWQHPTAQGLRSANCLPSLTLSLSVLVNSYRFFLVLPFTSKAWLALGSLVCSVVRRRQCPLSL